MKLWNSSSLRISLTWRMMSMQALVLIAFTAVASIPVSRLLSEKQGIDETVIEEISRTIFRGDGGSLTFDPQGHVGTLSAKYPDLWFLATDAEGNTTQFGAITEDVSDLSGGLPRLGSANIADIGPPGAASAVLRGYETDAGSLWIIAGGGPQYRIKAALVAFGNPLFIGLFLILTLASFFFIPVLVTRQLRGVDRVAEEADGVDVTQRGIRLSSAHVPDELHSLVQAMNSALQRLDEGIERRQRFLADAAHELRTPIAILQTRIELLPDGEEKHRLMLDVARLTNLANQLLDLQRLDAGMTELKPVNLVELTSEVAANMAPLAIAAGDEISFEAESETVTVVADTASLSRAVTNLIQNAVIHGGRKASIRVGVGRDGSVRVADSGPGIAPRHRQAIFEPFGRVTPLDHGAGLGLSLVKDIVQRHNGRITVGDAPEGGALFEISLPLASA